ncbi:hypothetical protein LTS18_003013, partial [Coniosporium uncinatum]
MNEGQWLDPVDANNSHAPYRNWQPSGCMLHSYQPGEIKQCVEDRTIVFAGDSTIRQVFWATARKLNESAAYHLEHTLDRHNDHALELGGVKIKFIWDPFLNGSKLREEMQSHYEDATGGYSNAEPIAQRTAAAYILAGGGPWFARWFEDGESLRQYQEAINNITQYTADLDPTYFSEDGIGNQVFIMPGQVPLYDLLRDDRAAAVQPGEVEAMDSYLEQHGKNVMFSFSAMTDNQPASLNETDNVFHVIDNVADVKAEVLFNLRCNAKLDRTGDFPFDRTCCSSYAPMQWVQLITIVACVVCLLAAIVFSYKGWFQNEEMPTGSVPFAALVIALALLHCFVADRTQIFTKLSKQYTNLEFFVLCGATLGVGLVTVRASNALPSRKIPTTTADNEKVDEQTTTAPPPDQPFLSRDQTEEWKGWMQFAILIYHWTGASRILWIYQIIRLMVGSYLFLTGYGHTLFFLKKADYSFSRAANVLVRLNLLSCALPYVMGTNYSFYYFAPLVSFWFLVLWATMYIGHAHNGKLSFLIGKILISCVIMSVILPYSGAYNLLFALLKLTCRIDWDVKEWTFRVGLDRFIVYIGMLTAIAHTHFSASSLAASPWYPSIKLTSIVAAGLSIPLYALCMHSFPAKASSNAIHPY